MGLETCWELGCGIGLGGLGSEGFREFAGPAFSADVPPKAPPVLIEGEYGEDGGNDEVLYTANVPVAARRFAAGHVCGAPVPDPPA